MEQPYSQAYRAYLWAQYRVLMTCLVFGIGWVVFAEYLVTPETFGAEFYVWLDKYSHWMLILLTSLLAYFFVHQQRNRHHKLQHILSRDAKRFHAIIQNVPNMVFVTDLRANITYMNRTLPQLTLDDVIGRNVFEFADPDDHEVIRAAIRKALETGEPVYYEAGNPRDFGEAWYAVQIQPLFAAGKIHNLAFFLTDITDRKRAEDALRESEARYRDVASNIPNMMVYQFVLTAGGDFKMPFVSSKSYEMFGVTPEEAQEDVETLLCLVHPEDAEVFYQSIADSAKHMSIWAHEFRVCLDKGNTVWIRGTSTPRRLENGDILWNGVLVDSTQEHQDKAHREELEKQLQHAQKMEALGTLAGGIAHDFNNFLQIITMSLELAQQNIKKPDQALQYLERALATSSRGRHLIRQILTFCRNEEVERKSFDLSSAITDFLQMIRATAPPTTRFNYQIEPRLSIYGNMTQFHQILINLCTNSFYALKEKEGSINIHLSSVSVSDKEAESLGLATGAYAELVVEDDGKGMTPEQVNRIFDPFYTTKPVGQGTGLGLSVVHGVIRSHGGHIQVRSELGQGTQFRILLPLVQLPDTSAEQSLMSPTPGRGQWVLVIEDESDLLDLETSMLEGMGYNVIKASTGKKALQVFQELGDKIELVISDNSLPGISGLEVFRELRKLNHQIPLVLTSGLGEEELRQESQLASVQVDHYLPKPFTHQELGETLQRILPTYSPAHPTP